MVAASPFPLVGGLIARVLIVEDDAVMRDVICRCFVDEGFGVEAVGDASRAVSLLSHSVFDAIVLDVVLPDDTGISVCRRIRSRGIDTPILLLSGRTRLADRVLGLDAGADDFVAKPFEVEELLARVRALTRRGRTRHLSAVLKYGALEVDQHDGVARVDGQLVSLTATEFRLLEFFLRRAETLVTRQELAQHVWDGDLRDGSNVIDVYVGYLRRKLGASGALVRTIRRAGYALENRPE
jgi:DNA-binding response OmpR family regulator